MTWNRDLDALTGAPETVDGDSTLTRRCLVRLASAGAGALALAGYGVGSLAAQEQTPEAQPDPEPDPEAEGTEIVEYEATPVAGGTPVGSAGNLTVYSGRNENLIGPLIPRFEAATGVDAEVRYGDTGELAATILEEGNNTPASLFFSQDAGALGALAKEGRLAPLPQEILDRVDPRFRSPDGVWVGTSARARVAVYNTEMITEEELPDSVLEFTDPKWKGKLGWAPTNGSFQAFVTALRVLEGEDAAREWLEGVKANEPKTFDGNGAIVRAVAAGEFPVGLVNHYYLYEVQEQDKQTYPLANHFFAEGDPGSLINVAGVGVLEDADNPEQALAMVDYLLSHEAQEYFAKETFEYPVIEGVELAEGLTPLEDLPSPEIDLSDLNDLQGTLALLAEVGII